MTILYKVYRDKFPDYIEGEDFFLRTQNFHDNNILYSEKVTPKLRISPNPCQDYTRLLLDNNENLVEIRVFNIHGKELYRKFEMIDSNGILLQSHSWSPGMYLIRIIDSMGNQSNSKLQVVK